MVNLLHQRWYILIDDLVGGWSVANVDKGRVSEPDWAQGEVTVADLISEEIAHYIVKRHNLSLDILQAVREGHFDVRDEDLPGAAGVGQDDAG